MPSWKALTISMSLKLCLEWKKHHHLDVAFVVRPFVSIWSFFLHKARGCPNAYSFVTSTYFVKLPPKQYGKCASPSSFKSCLKPKHQLRNYSVPWQTTQIQDIYLAFIVLLPLTCMCAHFALCLSKQYARIVGTFRQWHGQSKFQITCCLSIVFKSAMTTSSPVPQLKDVHLNVPQVRYD